MLRALPTTTCTGRSHRPGNPERAGDDTGRARGDLKKQLDGAVAQAALDAFGFGSPLAAFDTTSHGIGPSVTASETTSRPVRRPTWIRARAGTRNAPGKRMGISLAVAHGTTYPHCMQHQVANLAGSLDGWVGAGGAVVEGRDHLQRVVSGMRTCPVNGVDVFVLFNATATFQEQRPVVVDRRAGHRPVGDQSAGASPTGGRG